jgi:tRNA modification GTPase
LDEQQKYSFFSMIWLTSIQIKNCTFAALKNTVMPNTICAISTPSGLGAIAIVRASGSEAFSIAAKLFPDDSHFNDISVQQARFTQVYDGEQLIDQVVVTKFAAPHSYTGEDMVEISCHGSLFIQKKILELLLDNGCRMAQPGEFTQRAFLNGKLDLPQAEAVADLIESQSEATHRIAISQLKGDFSKHIHQMREQFVQMAALVELELDFSEEDVEFANRDELLRLVDHLEDEVGKMIQSFKLGNVLKRGIPVAIVGKPNVGKSTLLNALLQHERAIVSHIPGTTRDTIEDTIHIDGTLFRFIDTAGIRQSDDELENIGIQRTYQAIEEASVILYMVDVTHTNPEDIDAELDTFNRDMDMHDKLFLIVANKIDELETLPTHYSRWHDLHVCFISAKRRVNIEEIQDKLRAFVQAHSIQDATLLTNERHYALLCSIAQSLARIREGIRQQIPTDLLAEDIRAALHDLGCLTGTIATDDLLNHIFGHFCIGK